jgi:transcriptional regulator with PAS, ATPase and Fis domain
MTTNVAGDRRPEHLRIVSESALWRDVLRIATLVAANDAAILVSGESEPEKEVRRHRLAQAMADS